MFPLQNQVSTGSNASKTARYAVFALRILMLIAASALVAAGFALTLRDGSAPHATRATHACPMHPEVTAPGPAECPVCKMVLEPIASSERATTTGATVAPSTAAYTCPMHLEVGADAPGTCPKCNMDLELRAAKPAPPAPARATKTLYGCASHRDVIVDAPGQCPFCRADLRPLGAAERAAVRANVIPVSNASFAAGVTWLPESFPPAQSSQPGDGPAIGTAKRRVFVDDVRASAWFDPSGRVVALLYRDELVGLTPGEAGRFFRAAAPRDGIDVRLSEEPPSRWDATTSLVRFVIDPDEQAGVGAGETGWLELQGKSRELLVFPESALLRSSEGPYVLVPGAEGHAAQRRQVEIGRILKGNVVVLSGLAEGDRLIVGNAFFVDAEQRWKGAP
jgi:hypothetical protein